MFDKKMAISIESLKKDLGLDIRAFVKKYAKNLKGPGKVTLLVFYLTKNQDQSISSEKIEKEWNKMKSILGGKYHPVYLTRAREYGCLRKDGTKKNHYLLTSNWFDKLIRKYPKWAKQNFDL